MLLQNDGEVKLSFFKPPRRRSAALSPFQGALDGLTVHPDKLKFVKARKKLKIFEKSTCNLKTSVLYSLSHLRDESKRTAFFKVGVYYNEGPPVPIPNTVVKLISAENTWLEAARENRSAPTLTKVVLQ